MRLKKILLTTATALLLANAATPSDVVTEATIGSGYQANLFSDSAHIGDAYGSAGINLQYYPSGFAQLSSRIRYDAYSTYSDLSNLSGEVAATIIPTKESSPLSIVLSTSAALRRFGPLYQLYDRNGFTIGSDLSYRLTSTVYLTGSAALLHTTYVNSDYGSSTGCDLSLGTSLTLFGSNSLALLAQYTDRSYDQPALTTTNAGMGMTQRENRDVTFQIYGATLRYSRPLGQRTGLTLSAAHRELTMDENLMLYGYSIDYLSPWSNLWEGLSLSAGLKHFFPHQWIAGISGGYYDKDFAPVMDADETGSLISWSDNRSDQLTTVSFSLARPVTLRSGKLITPSLTAGYRRNQSTVSYFDYDDVWTSFSLNMTL